MKQALRPERGKVREQAAVIPVREQAQEQGQERAPEQGVELIPAEAEERAGAAALSTPAF